MKVDENKKYYFAKAANADSLDAFSYVVEKGEAVSIWEEGKDKNAEEFEPIDYDQESKVMRFKSKGGLLTKLAGSKLTDKEVYIKVPHPKFQFFTTAILKYDKDTSEYYVELDRDVFKSQRRENFRLKASKLSVIQFKIDDQVFDGLDISAGGTSIVIGPEDKERFTKDMVFENCIIRLNAKSFDIPQVRIAGTWQWKDKGGNETEDIKVGISFIDLSKGLEEDLFKHINSEARAEEVKKKFGK